MPQSHFIAAIGLGTECRGERADAFYTCSFRSVSCSDSLFGICFLKLKLFLLAYALFQMKQLLQCHSLLIFSLSSQKLNQVTITDVLAPEIS